MTEDPLLIDCRHCGQSLSLTVVGVDEWNGVHVSHVDRAEFKRHIASHDDQDGSDRHG